MKAAVPLLLIAALLFSNGCITWNSVERASGRGGEWVEVTGSDQVIRSDGKNCVIKRTVSSGQTNEISLHLVTPIAGYVRKPGYYGLLPLTIPADIATAPFQVIFFFLFAGEGAC